MTAPAGSAFRLLSPELQAFLDAEGFTAPTPAQEAALPVILSGAHTLLIAPTGMGKTESAIIPIFDRLLELKRGPDRPKGISVVYVTPLRALNRDLMGRLEAWGRALKIDVAVRHGDTPQAERQRQSRKPPDVLITTPETVQILFLGKRLRESLATVRWVVVDEVHELAEDERGAQLACALERLVALAGEFQRVGLSATVGDEREVAAFLGGVREVRTVKVPVAKRLDLRVITPLPDERATRTAEKIMSRPDVAAHLNACLDLIRDHTSTLLFVNTRETAEVLTARVRMLDPEFPLTVHHGSLSKEVRISAEEAFKSGVAKGLVCTSSMELGIDIGSADLVVQYTSPRQATRLVQRVGRAGHRADLVSNGIIVATDPDDIAEAAVIVERTLTEQLEKFPMHAAPLDVLVNQLAAMALDSGRLSSRGAYELLRKAAPFRALAWEDFDAALKQLAQHWVVWHDGTYFGSKARTRTYFHENISMIPDSKTYRVVNIATSRSVATLDEGFVASFVEPGAAFIAQGQPWRVAEIDSEEAILRVEPIKDPLGAVPSWVGEEIPVPFSVAQGVGRLRREVRDLAAAEGSAAAEAAIAARYRLDAGAAATLAEYIEEQQGYELPTDEVVTLEAGGRHCVVNGAFGTKVNETLGRLLSSLLTARIGTSVGLTVDPYRVILEMPARTGGDAVRRLLLETPPEAVPSLMELVLAGSHYLRYRMVHVARKFGVLSRDVDYKKVNVARLLDLYKGTPLWRETMREVLHDRLDVPLAQEILRRIQAGEIRLVVQGLSPIGAAGLDTKVELVSPARADRTLLAAMRQRLENEKVVLLCMNCKKWSSETRVSRAANVRACPECAGRLVAAVRPWHKESLTVWKKAKGGESKLKVEEKKELARLATSANLVFDHGEKALLALVARGVGPDTAGRLLHKQRTDEEQFLRDILEAEVTYARTRAFWD